jgi:FkbM family methyltransferase
MCGDWEVRCHPAAVEAFELQRDAPELRAELDAFVSSCREGMVLLDIGAHYGLFTLAALHFSRGAARVIAADPSASAIAVFDTNMRLAGAGPRVDRYRVAVAEADGEVPLLTGGARAYHMMTRSEAPRPDAVVVPAITLDSLSDRAGVVPTHIKIDVEGAEDAVLSGGERTLRERRPIVFLELHGGILRRAGRDPLAVLERLASWGYRRFEIAGRTVDLRAVSGLDVARITCG